MTQPLDEKVYPQLLHYIEKSCMKQEEWAWTLLNQIHPEIAATIQLEDDEIPVVSIFFSPKEWTLLTTRTVWTKKNSIICVPSWQIESEQTDGIPKEAILGGSPVDVMHLKIKSGAPDISFTYETGYASMAPIYYFRYWTIKFPILYREWLSNR